MKEGACSLRSGNGLLIIMLPTWSPLSLTPSTCIKYIIRVSWLNLEILLHKNIVVQDEKVERPSEFIIYVI